MAIYDRWSNFLTTMQHPIHASTQSKKQCWAWTGSVNSIDGGGDRIGVQPQKIWTDWKRLSLYELAIRKIPAPDLRQTRFLTTLVLIQASVCWWDWRSSKSTIGNKHSQQMNLWNYSHRFTSHKLNLCHFSKLRNPLSICKYWESSLIILSFMIVMSYYSWHDSIVSSNSCMWNILVIWLYLISSSIVSEWLL